MTVTKLSLSSEVAMSSLPSPLKSPATRWSAPSTVSRGCRERRSIGGRKITGSIALHNGNLAVTLVGHRHVEDAVAVEIAGNDGVRHQATDGKSGRSLEIETKAAAVTRQKGDFRLRRIGDDQIKHAIAVEVTGDRCARTLAGTVARCAEDSGVSEVKVAYECDRAISALTEPRTGTYCRDGTVTFISNFYLTDSTILGTSSYCAGQGPSAAVAGDFNGDGVLDLVVTNATAAQIAFLPGNGSGLGFNFQAPATFPAVAPFRTP